MSLALTWSFATEADLPDLQDFVCTDAPTFAGTAETASDPWWESDVEVALQELPFPLQRREYVLLGRDHEGLAAISWCWEQHGPQTVKILAVAAAQRLRRRGLKVGDKLLSRTLDEIVNRADAARLPVAMAYARIHSSNDASLKLFQRNRFFYASGVEGFDELWLRIDLPEHRD